MLLLLPLLAFVLVFLLALGERLGVRADESDPRGPFILALICWGTLVVTISEGLGALGLIRQLPLALIWLAVSVSVLAIGVRRGSLRRAVAALESLRLLYRGWEAGLLLGTAALVGLLLTIALIAPANNVDSLLYHMSRVMHWAQNGSLRHYATGYHNQLLMPPWSEMAILNLRVLMGNDRAANLVQWFAMLGNLLGVSAIARLLGGKSTAQVLAAVFAVTIPMGILQATSTQNDLAVALWLVCCAYLVLLSLSRPLEPLEYGALGLAFGLGLLTKVTFVALGLPIATLFVVSTVRRRGSMKALVATVSIVVLAYLLNVPTWSRNYATYRGLYGNSDWMSSNFAPTQLFQNLGGSSSGTGASGTGRTSVTSRLASGILELARWPASQVAQAAALNLVTPSSLVNELLWGAVDSVPRLFGQVVTHSLRWAAWSHEDSAGNPIHLFMVLISAALAVFGRRSIPRAREVLVYSALALISFGLLSILVGPASANVGVRYQLPFFVIWSPVFGLVLARQRASSWAHLVSVGLLVSAVPYALFNNTRPIIGHPPWPTRVQSILTAPAVEILFAANPHSLPEYRAVTDWVEEADCRQVGLRLDSGDPEYEFWWLLDAPQSGVRIESVYTYPSLEHLLDSTYQPCAVICTICSDETDLGELELTIDNGAVRLYALPGLGDQP